MTFIAESKVSSAACARYYNIGSQVLLSAGFTLKPQSVATWGASGNWSYNDSTGEFTLNSSYIYLVEADIFAGRNPQTGNLRGSVIGMITDGSGSELSNSSRGVSIINSCERYYNAFETVADQTTFAIIDGSSISSFFWKVQGLQQDVSVDLYLNNNAASGAGTFGFVDSRLVIREYPA